MVERELRDFLASLPTATSCAPTLGHLIRLRIDKSPFIMGGNVTEADIRRACKTIVFNPFDDDGHPLMPLDDIAAEIRESIASAFRALEIIQPETGKRHASRKSKYADWSPEWLADIIASVATAVPGTDTYDILWGMSACQAFHLVAAAVRKNGGSTRRPEDRASVIAALDRLG